VGRTPLARQRRQQKHALIRKATWPVRLRFFIIGVAFAFCWWFGADAMRGRVSFTWAAALGSQIEAFTTSLRLPVRQPVTADRAVTEQPQGVNAQRVPAPTAGVKAGAPPNGETKGTPSGVVITPAPTAVPTPVPATAVPTARPVTTRDARTQTEVTNSAKAKETAAAESARATATAAGDAGAASPHTIYVVRDGDTLFGIARRYGFSLSELADYNHLQPPYRLIKGARLLIPAT